MIVQDGLTEDQGAILRAHVQTFLQSNPSASIVQIKQISNEAMQRLFPDFDCFAISYRTPKNFFWNRSAVAGVVRTYTIAANVDTGEIVTLPREGTLEEYANFLAIEGITLTTHEQATVIWTSLEAILGRTGPNAGRHRKVSETEWQLGWEIINGRAYWYTITTDQTGAVLSGRRESEVAK